MRKPNLTTEITEKGTRFRRRGMEMADETRINAITEKVVGDAIDVHRALGPGLLESTYRTCLASELRQSGLKVEVEKELPLVYKGVKLDCGCRIDVLVNSLVVVELKCLDAVATIHDAQLLWYRKLSSCPVGLLSKFNVR
jgi:GxxExxY protein